MKKYLFVTDSGNYVAQEVAAGSWWRRLWYREFTIKINANTFWCERVKRFARLPKNFIRVE